jgi:two-component system response regulator NreC
MAIEIVLTEDHEMFLEGLTLLLNKQPEFQVKSTHTRAETLLASLPDASDPILLLDVHLPDMEAEDLLKEIRKKQPTIKIIYLTMMRGTRNVHRLIRHNIQGYILKNAPIQELSEAIQTVHQGGTWFSKDIDVSDNQHDFRQTITIEENRLDEILTKREIEIMKLVCREYSNSEIAEKLFLSVGTVETHRKNIISKLGVNNTVGLVKLALRNKLID